MCFVYRLLQLEIYNLNLFYGMKIQVGDSILIIGGKTLFFALFFITSEIIRSKEMRNGIKK